MPAYDFGSMGGAGAELPGCCERMGIDTRKRKIRAERKNWAKRRDAFKEDLRKIGTRNARW
jgi:hypothetical protein